MGQAKQRGTLEQRVKQAQEQKDDFYGTERSVAEVLAELGLPKESTVKGYVIHLLMTIIFLFQLLMLGHLN